MGLCVKEMTVNYKPVILMSADGFVVDKKKIGEIANDPDEES